ncbi:hypothetical protein HK101_010707 [Irineochytrium annulatum]|nr:hypothetical protein HK101_010707 [Irineochytrium annulatum]
MPPSASGSSGHQPHSVSVPRPVMQPPSSPSPSAASLSTTAIVSPSPVPTPSSAATPVFDVRRNVPKDTLGSRLLGSLRSRPAAISTSAASVDGRDQAVSPIQPASASSPGGPTMEGELAARAFSLDTPRPEGLARLNGMQGTRRQSSAAMPTEEFIEAQQGHGGNTVAPLNKWSDRLANFSRKTASTAELAGAAAPQTTTIIPSLAAAEKGSEAEPQQHQLPFAPQAPLLLSDLERSHAAPGSNGANTDTTTSCSTDSTLEAPNAFYDYLASRSLASGAQKRSVPSVVSSLMTRATATTTNVTSDEDTASYQSPRRQPVRKLGALGGVALSLALDDARIATGASADETTGEYDSDGSDAVSEWRVNPSLARTVSSSDSAAHADPAPSTHAAGETIERANERRRKFGWSGEVDDEPIEVLQPPASAYILPPIHPVSPVDSEYAHLGVPSAETPRPGSAAASNAGTASDVTVGATAAPTVARGSTATIRANAPILRGLDDEGRRTPTPGGRGVLSMDLGPRAITPESAAAVRNMFSMDLGSRPMYNDPSGLPGGKAKTRIGGAFQAISAVLKLGRKKGEDSPPSSPATYSSPPRQQPERPMSPSQQPQRRWFNLGPRGPINDPLPTPMGTVSIHDDDSGSDYFASRTRAASPLPATPHLPKSSASAIDKIRARLQAKLSGSGPSSTDSDGQSRRGSMLGGRRRVAPPPRGVRNIDGFARVLADSVASPPEPVAAPSLDGASGRFLQRARAGSGSTGTGSRGGEAGIMMDQLLTGRPMSPTPPIKSGSDAASVGSNRAEERPAAAGGEKLARVDSGAALSPNPLLLAAMGKELPPTPVQRPAGSHLGKGMVTPSYLAALESARRASAVYPAANAIEPSTMPSSKRRAAKPRYHRIVTAGGNLAASAPSTAGASSHRGSFMTNDTASMLSSAPPSPTGTATTALTRLTLQPSHPLTAEKLTTFPTLSLSRSATTVRDSLVPEPPTDHPVPGHYPPAHTSRTLDRDDARSLRSTLSRRTNGASSVAGKRRSRGGKAIGRKGSGVLSLAATDASRRRRSCVSDGRRASWVSSGWGDGSEWDGEEDDILVVNGNDDEEALGTMRRRTEVDGEGRLVGEVKLEVI